MTIEEIKKIAEVTGPVINSEGWLYGGTQDLLKFANMVEKIVTEKLQTKHKPVFWERRKDGKISQTNSLLGGK